MVKPLRTDGWPGQERDHRPGTEEPPGVSLGPRPSPGAGISLDLTEGVPAFLTAEGRLPGTGVALLPAVSVDRRAVPSGAMTTSQARHALFGTVPSHTEDTPSTH